MKPFTIKLLTPRIVHGWIFPWPASLAAAVYDKCFPLILSNSGSSIQSCFKKHEAINKRAYESRICKVKHSTFTSLVFSATRGMAHEATIFCKKLFSLLSDKWKEPYASVLGWVRFTFLSYTLISNTTHRAFSRPLYIKSAPVDLIQLETQILC